jgi:hypothetical protein
MWKSVSQVGFMTLHELHCGVEALALVCHTPTADGLAAVVFCRLGSHVTCALDALQNVVEALLRVVDETG